MGYFDALTSSYFKSASDGRKLFFPWGVFGHGYVLPSEADYERLRRQTKVYTIAALALIIVPSAMQTFVVMAIMLVALLTFYVIWIRRVLRGLEPSQERLSLRESMASQGRAHNATMLWLLEFASLVFVATGLLLLVFKPGEWLTALASIGFFGVCSFAFAFMLIARRRAVP